MTKGVMKGVIPIEQLKIIVANPAIELRTRAMVVAVYACGCRSGEMFRYKHRKMLAEVRRARRTNKIETLTDKDYAVTYTEGLTIGNVTETERSLKLAIPNFKNRKLTDKAGIILKDSEKWMYDVFMEYFNSIEFKFPHNMVFPISATYARLFIDAALKTQDPRYSSHWLRHSRATELVPKTDIDTLRKYMGHSSMESTGIYLHRDVRRIEDDVYNYDKENKGEANAVIAL